MKSTNRCDGVPKTGAWQPLPTPGARGCPARVSGGQTASERCSPSHVSPTSSSFPGWSNENRRWEHGGSLGGQHSWPGGRHQAGDQLGCQVATIPFLLQYQISLVSDMLWRRRESVLGKEFPGICRMGAASMILKSCQAKEHSGPTMKRSLWDLR